MSFISDTVHANFVDEFYGLSEEQVIMKYSLLSLALFCAMVVISVLVFGFPASLAWAVSASEPPVTALSSVEIGWVVGNSAGDGYGVILHTVDGGQNWVRQGQSPDVPDVNLYAVWAADANYVWVVGSISDGYALILRSTDGGVTWQRQGNASQIPNVELFGIHGLDRNNLWVVGDNCPILHTTDGGQTWTQQTGGTVPVGHYEGVWAIDNNHVWVGGVETSTQNGVILRTTDGGATWERRDAGASMFQGHYVIKVYGADKDTAWAVGNGSMLAHTADAGGTWSSQSPLPGPDMFDTNGVFFVDHDTGWVARDNDTIWSTQNGGTQWFTQTSPSHGFYLLRTHALDEQKAWMVGESMPVPPQHSEGIVLHTEDGGSNWYIQTVPVSPSFSCVWFVDNQLHGTLTAEVGDARITYTAAISSPSPQANLVVTGSIPTGATFVSVSGGEYVPSGGDYNCGYVTSPNTVTLQVGQTYYLIWAVDLPGSLVDDLENQAHARSDSAPMPLDLVHHLYRIAFPWVAKNAAQ